MIVVSANSNTNNKCILCEWV